MRILFDQGTPAPLRQSLNRHVVQTVFEEGWDKLENGELLKAAENAFDALVTTDQNLKYQQNLAGRNLAILVLPFASWPRLQPLISGIVSAVDALRPGDYVEIPAS